LSRLRDADVTVYRTDIHGDVTCISDGAVVEFQTQKQVPPLFYDQIQPRAPNTIHKEAVQEKKQPPLGTSETELSYIGNKRSKVFHHSECSAAARISSPNRVLLSGRADAINQNFRPCAICKP
jgi:competence protein ComEC